MTNFACKDDKLGTINIALYRRLKEGSLFELETAINRLMLQLQLQPILKFRRLQTGLVVVDGLVASLDGGLDLVAGVELVVEAVLAVEDDDEADLSKRPNDEPNLSWLVKT